MLLPATVIFGVNDMKSRKNVLGFFFFFMDLLTLALGEGKSEINSYDF